MVGDAFPSFPHVADAFPIIRSLLTSEPSNAAGSGSVAKLENIKFLPVDCTMWRLGYDAGDEPTVSLSPLEERNDER